jgi:hypothetical protein
MGFNLSIVYIAVLLAAIWLLIEILSIVFKITGLDLNKARFQIISILTHTGFTTRESELIAQHPLRRKLASILMLLSYVAQASLISLLINMISQDTQELLYTGIFLVIVCAIIILMTRNKYMSSKFDKLVARIVQKRLIKQAQRPVDQVLKISPGYGVYEVLVEPESRVANKTLREARLHDLFIQVLKIDRGSTTLDFPEADSQIQPGDVLIVYGKIRAIKELASKS